MSVRKSLKIGALTLFGVGVVLLFIFFDAFEYVKHPHLLRALIEPYGIWAPIIYMVLSLVATVLLFPHLALGIAGGLLFGPVQGFVYLFVGATAGAEIAFYGARFVGADFVQSLIKKYGFGKYMGELKVHGFSTALMLRVMPLVPFSPLSYVLGLSSLSAWDYFFATALGSIPSTIIHTYFGNSVAKLNVFEMVLWIGLLFLLAIPVRIYQKKFETKERTNNTNNEKAV